MKMPLTYDEANKIIAREDPRHEKYYSRDWPDRNLQREVIEAFERQHPGDFDLTESLPVHINEGMDKEAVRLGLTKPTTPVPPEVTQPATQPQTQPETPVTQTTEQPATAQSYSPLWDTPQAEALTSYKAVYGADYEQAMVADAQHVFVSFAEDYIQRQGGTPEARAHVGEYVDQLMRRMGNHPLNAQFLRYVGHRLSYFAK
jgi:hypothetical protein